MMHSSRLSDFLKSRVCFDKKRLERFGAQAAFFLAGFFLTVLNPLYAQCVLSGTITDRNSGEPLSFVSVYVKGQTQLGAVSNLSGYYQLNLPVGADSLEIAFQYVGYRTEVRSVLPKGTAISLDVSLEQVALPLQGVEITADAEDPAYAIMRKVIARRDEIKAGRPAYECKAYVKGLIRLLDTPEQVFGQEVGDMGGVLDTAGTGVLYFSESFSELKVVPPDLRQERVIASKVSGSDDFGINSVFNAGLDVYENTLPFDRPIVSPIGDQALSFYRYRLEGTYFDAGGREINRISCWPRAKDGPAFAGMLYVLEDEWVLTAAELSISGASMNQPALDSLVYRLSWVPLGEQQAWLPWSQSLQFSGHVFGFVFGGYFMNRYGEYDFPEKAALKAQINKREVFVVEPDALEQGRTYFDSLRPLPLTEEEQLDYHKKDSLQAIWESPAYQDSLDRVANRFTTMALLAGYTHRNTRKRRQWGIYSPLSLTGFNAVQGVYYGSGGFFKQSFDKKGYRYLKLNAVFDWGYAEHILRPRASAVFHLNEMNQAELSLSGGLQASSLNGLPVPTAAQNELASLYAKRNLLRLYEKAWIGISWEQELWNGFWAEMSLSAFRRRALNNHSQYSFLKRDAFYPTNHPDGVSAGEEVFASHEGSLLEVEFRWQPGQRYMLLPDRKIPLGDARPEFGLSLRRAFPASLPFACLPCGEDGGGVGAALDYLYLKVSYRQREWSWGPFGKSELFLQAGFFPYAKQLYLPDQFHFAGNRTYLMGRTQDLYRQFLRLPYFKYSTAAPHAELHWQHHFGGLLTDHLPLIRKWNIATVFSARGLLVQDRQPYGELALGWENLGFGAFRFWRIDVAVGFAEGQRPDWGVFLSSSFDLGGGR